MKNHANGQMLIEMIVVIGVVVVLATGIIAGTSSSLARTQGNQARSSALQYAQEGIEYARQKRDAGWTSFAGLLEGTQSITYCVDSNNMWTAPPCAVNIASVYTRSITLSLADGNILIDVIVVWGDQSQPDNNVELKTTLTQWK